MTCGHRIDVRSSGSDSGSGSGPNNPIREWSPRELRLTMLPLGRPNGRLSRVPVSQILYVCSPAALKWVSMNHLSLLFPSGIPATHGSILLRTYDDLYRLRVPRVKTLAEFKARFDTHGRFAEVRRGVYVNTDRASELDADRSAVYFAFPDGTEEWIVSSRRNLLDFD